MHITPFLTLVKIDCSQYYKTAEKKGGAVVVYGKNPSTKH
jgi:hypothetical protein